MKSTIICVDDEWDILTSLGDRFECEFGKEYDIALASDGGQALEICAKLTAEGSEIPLVIADLNMPGMKGDSLLIQLHSIYPKTLKILLTGNADANSIGNIVNASALYRYIPKPWHESNLVAIASEALRHFQQEQTLSEQNKLLRKNNDRLHKSLSVLKHQAWHDELTNLPNRNLFSQKFDKALTDAINKSKLLAVMFLDLDRFKEINDRFGHFIGDLLLQSVVNRLVGCLRKTDTLARWGGDEFVMLMPGINHREDASEIACRLLEVLHPPFSLAGLSLDVQTSIGIAVFPDDGLTINKLLHNADNALYQAKRLGRNNYQYHCA